MKKKMILFSAVLSAGIFISIFSFSYLLEISKIHAESNHEEHEEDKEHNEHEKLSDNHNDHNGHDEHEEEEIISLSEAQIKDFDIKIEKAGSGRLNNYINLPGEIVLNSDTIVHLVPRLSGIVFKVFKTTGDEVKKDEVIAILESKDMGEAKIEYFTALANAEIAKVELASAITQIDVAKSDMEISLSRQKIVQANLDFQKVVHGNTTLLIKSLKEKKGVDTILEDLKEKPIGENKTRLLSVYSALVYSKADYNRESELRKKKISSESDFLSAENEFRKNKSEFQALLEEIEFKNTIELTEKKQDLEISKHEVKSKKQSVKIAEQEKTAKEVSLKVSQSNLLSALRKLKIFGLSEKDIDELRDNGEEADDLVYYKIRAPFSGTIIEKHITLGEMVQEDSETFVIADLDSVWVNLNIYQKDLMHLNKGQKVTVSLGHGIPDQSGKIEWINPIINEQTRTAVARILLPNNKRRLLPGMFVKGRTAVMEGNSIPLLIPKSAVQIIEGTPSVFIKTEKGFEVSSIKTGMENETHIEITSGIKQGDLYVKSGAFTLKAELAKGSFGDGHNH